MTDTTKPALPEPRLWYDPETQRHSSMAPLRPTYEPLWDEQDMRAAIAAEQKHKAEWKHLAEQLHTELSTLREQLAEARGVPDEWRDVVDDMLTVQHEVASDDPRESINRLINWHVSVALDPAVSSDAQALIDRGAAHERERCLKLVRDEQAMPRGNYTLARIEDAIADATPSPTPSARVALSDEQISNRLRETDWPEVMLSDFVRAKLYAFARAIERAHDIGPKGGE